MNAVYINNRIRLEIGKHLYTYQCIDAMKKNEGR